MISYYVQILILKNWFDNNDAVKAFTYLFKCRDQWFNSYEEIIEII